MLYKTGIKCLLSITLLFLFATTALGHQQPVVIPLKTLSLAVVGYDGGDQFIQLGTIDKIIRTITLDVPARGLVIVNASGVFTAFAVVDRVAAARCSITQLNSIDISYLIIAGNENDIAGSNSLMDYVPFAGTRAIPVEKGSQTFNLVCDVDGVADNQIEVIDSNMNAVYHYIPNLVSP